MTDSPSDRASLTIVVVLHDMAREYPRTLYSLSSAYQRGVSSTEYRVLVVDNGSTEPVSIVDVRRFGPNFDLLRIDDAPRSPVPAVNRAAATVHTPFVGLMIDGARLASPGVVRLALMALNSFERAAVGTVGFHLGPEVQQVSVERGYDQALEDELLESVDWRTDGYQLFAISSFAPSSRHGWFAPMGESNLLFVPTAQYRELDGFDERFDLPGGGLANADLYRRASELPGCTSVTLFGEGTFHQTHGGAITGRRRRDAAAELGRYRDQYRSIRGVPFHGPTQPPLLFGHAVPETASGLVYSGQALGAVRPPRRRARFPYRTRSQRTRAWLGTFRAAVGRLRRERRDRRASGR